MPVSKKRKSSGKRKRPKFTYTRREAGDERFGLRLKGSRLMYLKDDPDFHAVIRMGRLLNSIMFASQAMADYFGDESATERARRTEHSMSYADIFTKEFRWSAGYVLVILVRQHSNPYAC